MTEKQECKDCNKSLEDCTCIEDTIEFTEADIKTFIDWVFNPAEPNQALKDAAERYIAGDNYNRYYDDFINGARWSQQQNDTSKVTRVEVIQHSPPYNGRAFTKYNAKDVEIQFQDDGRTLKIFLR